MDCLYGQGYVGQTCAGLYGREKSHFSAVGNGDASHSYTQWTRLGPHEAASLPVAVMSVFGDYTGDRLREEIRCRDVWVRGALNTLGNSAAGHGRAVHIIPGRRRKRAFICQRRSMGGPEASGGYSIRREGSTIVYSVATSLARRPREVGFFCIKRRHGSRCKKAKINL